MYAIIKNKWLVLVAWIALIVGLFMLAPNMADLVREKGQIDVPEGYSSSLASDIMENVQEQEGGGDDTQVALVFHSEEKLTDKEIQEAEKAIRALENKKEELGITEILTHFNEEILEEQLVSKDGKAILTSLSIEWKDREPKELSEALYETIEDVKVDHDYTSNWLINEDLMTSSQEGLKKTEGITVVFILVVLLLVFRSVVAPVIPLLTVGFSYLAAQSIVSILVDKLDFPVSSYTQIFLVAILFGIGTDYCILLLSRYKEELTHYENRADAIVATYRNAGRTVFFSGLAVMIGFAAIGFSKFVLYQSAAAVAVGVGLLLIALFTIVPFFMAVLGGKIFWPSKSTAEHGESKFWGVVGQFSLKRPVIALLIVAAVCVPFLVTYDGKLSYNSLEEISGDVHSIRAFNAIADGFGPGESMPTQIVLKNDEAMDSMEYINLVEEISKQLARVPLVDTVRSVTRPTGEPIEDFLIAKQADTLQEGLGEGKEGLDQISSGLKEASDGLESSAPQLEQATAGIGELVTGTSQVQSGLTEIQTNLAKIEDGIRQGAAGSAQIKTELGNVKSGAEQLLAEYKKLAGVYGQMGAGLNELSAALASTEQYFTALESSYPALQMDESYQRLKGTVQTVQPQLAGVASGMAEANAGFAVINENQQKIVSGLEQFIVGIDKQLAGLNQLANGQGQIVDNMPKLTSGLAGIRDGQQQLAEGFGELGGQLGQLTDGLNQSVDGLNQISDGLGSAQDYIKGLSENDNGAFYLPPEVLESEDFVQVLDTYMSNDRKVMTIDVILEANPYSNEAINQVDKLNEAVKSATANTKLENAVVAVGGVTRTNADLDAISGEDYSRTVVLMLVGITIILVILFRSMIMPAYIIASLILTFYTSMGINEAIFVNLLGYTGISWAVPFFGFVILIALGVDYSIFLMDRFNEYKDISIREAMLESMKKMGTVIISAAVILGGTFAAMMPSGMLSLLQIASIVLVGLFLYALVILPLFIPVMVRTFGKANWWPFLRGK
ncbi:MMPL family transporter [Robertmurraya sp. GLU-23]